MFALTRKTDYAIIALSHMARHVGSVCNAREIAERYHVPTALLMNVLKTMCRQELVRSIRGAKGGYALAMPAERLTLAVIIAAVEGPIRFVQCTGRREATESACDLLDVCPVKAPVHRIHEKLASFLEQITLADIVEDVGGVEPGVALSVDGAVVRKAPNFAGMHPTRAEV